jgi:hypothetical protein
MECIIDGQTRQFTEDPNFRGRNKGSFTGILNGSERYWGRDSLDYLKKVKKPRAKKIKAS